MRKGQVESKDILQAREIVKQVRANPLTNEKRKKLSLELAHLLLVESKKIQTGSERRQQKQLAKLMQDPFGKAFATALTDECFRSKNKKRIADQIIYLLNQYGLPKFLPFFKRFSLYIFKLLPSYIGRFLVPFATYSLRKESARVILPGEYSKLLMHILERKKEEVSLNINHLGEAVLGEKEAQRRLKVYLDDLKKPYIDYVSIKISTIFSQIHLIAWDYSLEKIAKNLRLLYRAAMNNPLEENGFKKAKFVNLDMEEYKDLHLTIEVFKKVLDEKEFKNFYAGIVLQAYLPDSFELQKQLTVWAKKRVKEGGSPIKIRLVKGANLANEQVEASLKGWPQTPYTTKQEVDSNYKRMLIFGLSPENARAVHIAIASHNLFDISFAILLRAENLVESYTSFEMLEGMVDNIRRVVQQFTGSILLYCPVARKEEFQHAIAYLVRRLDENTGEENFLRHLFSLASKSKVWDTQAAFFAQSCDHIDQIASHPRREQNRFDKALKKEIHDPFENEPDTDFSLPKNCEWAEKIMEKYKTYQPEPIPIVIGGKELLDNKKGVSFNPSDPKRPFYYYTLADKNHIDLALTTAKNFEKTWQETPVQKRCELAAEIAYGLREKRDHLLGIMMIDAGKILTESDPEVSEAIDKCEFYLRQMLEIDRAKDIQAFSKGTILVLPPWNFPCAIPIGGMVSALLSGNCVIFKPAPEVVLTGWSLVKLLWEAGIPKQALQFLNCKNDPEGNLLVQDERVNGVILTGSTATAKAFFQLRPNIDLSAETGGKNAMIVTAMSDRDLVIKDLVQSAFSHSGQKCSACSLAILEQEVYNDSHFRRQLVDAASSLKVGPSTDLSTKVGPLIRPANETLHRGLTRLEKKEEWLLEPKQDPDNPNLWSPGIKLGVSPESFTHQTELFGPVLGLMKAKNLNQAIKIANDTQYGLTAGLQSLDSREQRLWLSKIEAGNFYINRTMTGAIVRRQPFGGRKSSNFGDGHKAGGPNYLLDSLHLKQKDLPKEKNPLDSLVNNITPLLEKIDLSAEELGLWYASVSNYAYWWKRLKVERDVSKLVGQDNFFKYVPKKAITLRITDDTCLFDILRVCAAALSCSCFLQISWYDKEKEQPWADFFPSLQVVKETEKDFLTRVSSGEIRRVRILSKPSPDLYKAASISACHICFEPVLASGRYELLHYLQEVSISTDYHRYGNLGVREGELRKDIL